MKDIMTPFSLRMSDDIKDKVIALAEANERSLNSQVVFMIKQYLKDYEEKHGTIQV